MPETRLKLLSRWRRVATTVAAVVKRLYPEAEAYLVGGAAEGRLTVLSDVDIVVALPEPMPKEARAAVVARIWEELEKAGIPPYYPLHIIVVTRTELEKLKGRKVRLA